ncbi:MAG: FtsW/RodA/SpoVE family cell cycle protein [Solirubrobacteraceae bacterium]|nr:FtsW/RodA/SpoVE family cell cycle protein [Solirubrobacteraceae bacterium]
MHQMAAIRSGAVRPRHQLTVATVSLVVIGCLAVLSAADGSSTGSAFSYFLKTALFGIVGIGLMVFLGRGGRSGNGGLVLAHRFTSILLGLGVAGVIFVMLPTPITPTINGAKQWIVIPGGFTLQPSELLKPALVLHLAAALARDPWRVRSWTELRPVLLTAGGVLGVIGMQDLGSALVTGAIVITILFIAGVPMRMLGLMMLGAALGAGALTLMAPERVERFTVFLAPFADRFDAGFQITNGLMAIGSGGVFGHGIGESLQKHIIPEPQTDFILPVIMEEVGLLGATIVMALYLWTITLGLRIARESGQPYDRLVAAGLTSILLWQAGLNIWAVLGIAPLTGVPLPLISAGGSSEVLILGVVGLLIDIDRRTSMGAGALVVPTEPPRVVPKPVAVPVADSPRTAPPEPQPGELRVVDQRPAPSEPIAAPSDASAQTSPHDAARGSNAPATRRRGSVSGRRRSPGRASAAADTAPRVIERVGGMEILADGTVRLPGGRVGRPKSPIALPDGRVLMPDGKLVSREQAALLVARAAKS